MTPDALRGHNAFRCGCGVRIKVTVPAGKQCAGYRDDQRCRSAIAADLPVDLCAEHAEELRALWRLDLTARQRAEDEQAWGPDRFAAAQASLDKPKDPNTDRARWLGLNNPSPDQHDPIVYYLQFGDRIKIGTTTNLKVRLTAIPHDEVLVTEPGDASLERRRHRQFARLRVTGEWFRRGEPLLAHIKALKAAAP